VRGAARGGGLKPPDGAMRIAIVTDAWEPQVNGVVRTLASTGAELERRGHAVRFVTPLEFRTVPCPTYPEIRLAVCPARRVAAILDDLAPHAIHIATEGPLGHAARRYCRAGRLPFTTSFHTQFPEYIRLRAPLPLAWSYAYLRRFHAAAVRTLVPTPSQRARLLARGFANLALWARGVDTSVFHPGEAVVYPWPRPLLLTMGRVAVEKNIEAFLDLDVPGTKVVIGGGPDLARLREGYPAVHFLGPLFGRELARHVAGADVFVFPSRTDTFGLVLLEAMACGVPVAAFPVQGPIDVVPDGVAGALDEDLGRGVVRALALPRSACVTHAGRHTWAETTAVFAANLAAIPRAV
jgi:glycosyltransferase involved in cell wall biosynthesis